MITYSCDPDCRSQGSSLCYKDPKDGRCYECNDNESGYCQTNPDGRGDRCVGRICTCSGDGECKTSSLGKRCYLTTRSCGCKATADCAGGKICDTTVTWEEPYCVEGCKADGDCKSYYQPRCDLGSGFCVGCSGAPHCADSRAGTTCKNDACLCEHSGHCLSSYVNGATCNTTTRSCECSSDTECAGNVNGPHCDPLYSKCSCKADGECTRGGRTVCARGNNARQCEPPCAADGDCTKRSVQRVKCETTSRECVECLTSADCLQVMTYAPHCRVSEHSCEPCLNDGHCGVADQGGRCDTSGSFYHCVCLDNGDCVGNLHGSLCSGTYRACTCLGDGDCPAGRKCTGTYGMDRVCK